MRDINVTKYRKLLYNLQCFCKKSKSINGHVFCYKGIYQIAPMSTSLKKKKNLTDFERGCVAGKHSVYNDVLRRLHKMVNDAEFDWSKVHCREENFSQ